MKKITILCILLLCVVTGTMAQKTVTVSGIVSDSNKEPLIGVNIIVKDVPGLGAITDINGKYTIKVEPYNRLVFSYIGYKTQEVLIKEQRSVNIKMEEDVATTIDEVVITGTGAQRKLVQTGAITTVDMEHLMANPSSSVVNALAGNVAGVLARQTSGQPGQNVSEFWIRGISTFGAGTGAYILVDGFERSMDEINIEDIQDFSILKDATATAMYGTRGANGVMIVTTKSGQDLLKPIINFRLETSMSQLTSVPEMVGGVDYMKLYNEALTTRGITTGLYDDTKIRATEQGLNPLVYPNVDWYNEMFNKNAFAQRFNFNIRGGKKAVTYFMSASVKHDAGNLKSLSKDYFSYNNNINVMRYDFVNNLSIKATNTTKI